MFFGRSDASQIRIARVSAGGGLAGRFLLLPVGKILERIGAVPK